MHPSKSAVGLQTLCTSIQTMGERLTHLYLAHNRLTGIPQIVTALSVSNFLSCSFKAVMGTILPTKYYLKNILDLSIQ